MASKLIILFVVLFASQCSQAKEERSFLSFVDNAINAAVKVTKNITGTGAELIAETTASTKAAYDKAVALATQDFNTFVNKSSALIDAAILEANNVSAQIKNGFANTTQNFSSGVQAAIAKAQANLKEATEAAKQRGADVASCMSTFNSNLSSIANSSESSYETCSDPYVTPVLSTISHLNGLNAQAYQLHVETLQKTEGCAAKFDAVCFLGVVQNATSAQTTINSGVESDLKAFIPQSLLAKGGVASCATAATVQAGDALPGALSSAIKCLQNA